MSQLLLVLYGVLVILNVLDGYSTLTFVKPNHYEREKNPVARRMFTRLGIVRGILLAEFLWIGFITLVFFLLWSKPAFQFVLLVLLSLGVGIFSRIVVDNFRYCQSLKRREKESAPC